MLAEIATGITLFKAGQSLYKYVTGTTLSKDLEQISSRVEAKLEEIEHGITRSNTENP